MAKSLLEEIANQLTGKKANRQSKDAQKIIYQMRQNAFEVKRQAELMKLKAKSKGWI